MMVIQQQLLRCRAGGSIAHRHLPYLIYNPDAFRWRALEFTNADGTKQYINDIYWYGTTGHEHGHRHALHL
jgi:hypothetical protein